MKCREVVFLFPFGRAEELYPVQQTDQLETQIGYFGQENGQLYRASHCTR
jgi:hypothetical protein